MSTPMELAAEPRDLSGKKVQRLRRSGIVPANMYGHNQSSVPLQVNSAALHKLLTRGGNRAVLSLKVGNQPAVQALIKKVQHNPVTGEVIHVDFYKVAATEKLRTAVPLHFVNEPAPAIASQATVLRSMNEVMVECLPSQLPSSIEVDLSQLKEMGDVIRVGNLPASPGVTILADQNDMVAGLQQHARVEEAEEKVEAPATEPEAPPERSVEREQAD